MTRNEERARAYYWLWGSLPLDIAALLVEDGYIIRELEQKWDEEDEEDTFQGENV